MTERVTWQENNIKRVIEKDPPKKAKESVATKLTSSVAPKASGTGGVGKGSVSTAKAKKKLVDQEISVLSGEAKVTMVDFGLRAKGTVKVAGIGNILSGKYFIEKVQISISSSSGASQALTLIKNGFTDGASAMEAKHKTTRPSAVAKSVKRKTHIVRKGETLAKIAQVYRLSEASLVKLNKIKLKDSTRVLQGMELVVG